MNFLQNKIPQNVAYKTLVLWRAWSNRGYFNSHGDLEEDDYNEDEYIFRAFILILIFIN